MYQYKDHACARKFQPHREAGGTNNAMFQRIEPLGYRGQVLRPVVRSASAASPLPPCRRSLRTFRTPLLRAGLAAELCAVPGGRRDS